MASEQTVKERHDRVQAKEWLDSLDDVFRIEGPERAIEIVQLLHGELQRRRVTSPFSFNTPYINTIPVENQPAYPGDREIERRIKNLIRWNAVAMVVRANRESEGIGGHLATYQSAATLYEVGFNHFFRGKRGGTEAGDHIYVQGHAAPGIYARAFLEGRLTGEHLENFRRELQEGPGLSSYPHPWLMPDFWEFPTVSMGLGPIMAIYHARFNRYLHQRGLKDTSGSRVWAFLGDGECDEPEALGALSLAAREQLDNLTFVVNCNLQRLDGPVRGNGKIIQELEAVFRGAGWNVLKVIWGDDWDPLLAHDTEGWLVRRMEEAVDGDYQKYTVESGAYTREHFFGKYPALAEMVKDLSDDKIRKMRRGGHDPEKVYAAYKAAVEHRGTPTVILAKTVKGYGLGASAEGLNITHQQKKLDDATLSGLHRRFGIPFSDTEVSNAPFYRPEENSPEVQYMKARRESLGGPIPIRYDHQPTIESPNFDECFGEFLNGTDDKAVSTMMVFARVMSKLLRDDAVGKYVVPIIPDESRTFGLEPLFRQCGIYASGGQLYEPVDRDKLLYYREATDGQILEEGINEAGAMSSFIAAGTAYNTQQVPTIPFFIYYSMFGFQRIGDLAYAAADMRCKGFMCGGTAGRTSLAGEGLQHQDGHSHLLASTIPTVRAYDPAYAYELALIINDGIRRMYQEYEDGFYYVTIYNDRYPQHAMPNCDGVEEGVLKGMYLFRTAEPLAGAVGRVQLLGSGPILNEAIRAAGLLAQRYQIEADVWSVTSYQVLRRECLEVERYNRLHPDEPPRTSHLETILKGRESGPFIAASDYMKAVPDQIARWIPGPMATLGTDGFGRSEDRKTLRWHFEVNAEHICLAAIKALADAGTVKSSMVSRVIDKLMIERDAADPAVR